MTKINPQFVYLHTHIFCPLNRITLLIPAQEIKRNILLILREKRVLYQITILWHITEYIH